MRIPLLLFSLALAALAVLSFRTDDGSATTHRTNAANAVNDPAAAPMRILPGSVAAADWMDALLDDESRVVAIPEQVIEYSTMQRAEAVKEGRWSEHPRFNAFTSENVAAHDPDLVLASPFTDPAMVARVTESGFHVLRVPEPVTWSEILETGRSIGAAVHRERATERFIEELESRRRTLAERTGAQGLRVLPHSNSMGDGGTSGSGTTLDLALELAGYVNVAAEIGIEGPGDISAEQIVSADIDALLVSSTDGVSPSKEAMKSSPLLAKLPAVKGGRFIELETGLFTAGSFVILTAAEEIARQGDQFE